VDVYTTSASPRRAVSSAWPDTPARFTFTSDICLGLEDRQQDSRTARNSCVDVVDATMIDRSCATRAPEWLRAPAQSTNTRNKKWRGISSDFEIFCKTAMPSSFLFLVVGTLRWRVASQAPAVAQDRIVIVRVDTSTQDSGLFGYLLPIFKAKTNMM